MRALSVVALLLAFAAPASAVPFGKPRLLGTTPSAYEYDFIFSAPGPRGGVAFFVVGEKQVGYKITQRLYIARVEGNGRTHALTGTPVKYGTPGRSYGGGPPFADLAVGSRWRMLTTEVRASREYGINSIYGARLAANGRRLGARRMGPSNLVSGFLNTNARGDAIATYGDGFTIARSAGYFVRAPKALRAHERLPKLADDGSIYDLRGPDGGNLSVAYSSGRRWSKAQRVFTASPSDPLNLRDLVGSPGGDVLLVYGHGGDIFGTNLVGRWARRGGKFGPPFELGRDADPFSVELETIPGGRFAVRWKDRHGRLHLMRAPRRGSPFQEAASWPSPSNAEFRRLLPLANGRTVLAWATYDRDHKRPDRLMAAVIGVGGKIGPTQTIAVAPKNSNLDGYELRRLGANRAALVWTVDGAGGKKVRIALTAR